MASTLRRLQRALNEVFGPASSVDNSVVRFDGVSGQRIQGSELIADDTGNLRLGGHLEVPIVTTPATPTAGFGKLYEKSDKKPYFLNSDGTEVDLTVGAGGGFGFQIDGGSSPITTGFKKYQVIPYSGTITEWTIIANDSGSVVIDIWKVPVASFPPTNSNSITESSPPTLSSQQIVRNTSITGWTTSVTAGDVIGFNIDSIDGLLTSITLTVGVLK